MAPPRTVVIGRSATIVVVVVVIRWATPPRRRLASTVACILTLPLTPTVGTSVVHPVVLAGTVAVGTLALVAIRPQVPGGAVIPVVAVVAIRSIVSVSVV